MTAFLEFSGASTRETTNTFYGDILYLYYILTELHKWVWNCTFCVELYVKKYPNIFMLVTTLLQFSIEVDARSREYGRTKADDWFGVLIADTIDLMYNDVTRLDATDKCWSS